MSSVKDPEEIEVFVAFHKSYVLSRDLACDTVACGRVVELKSWPL